MKIRNVTAELWTLPLRAPFAISKRIAYTAENVFIFLEASDGHETVVGYGACAPVAYVTGETTQTALDDVASVAGRLIGLDLERLDPLLSLISAALPQSPAARAAVEMALYDAWAKSRRISLWDYFGASSSTALTDVTIPITDVPTAVSIARRAREAGYAALKIKVGACEGPHADFSRIEAIADAAPGVKLRIDANQAFTSQNAIDFAFRLQTLGATIELIEQPVAREDIDGLKAVRAESPYPVFADEAVCTPQDAWDLIARDAVDGINIKLMKSGIAGALRIIEICRAARKKLMIGCMLESTLGIAAAMQIASGTGAFDHIDLDSQELLAPVPEITGGLHACGPTLSVERDEDSFGWGVSVRARTGESIG